MATLLTKYGLSFSMLYIAACLPALQLTPEPTPEQLARDAIDRMLLAAGWQVKLWRAY